MQQYYTLEEAAKVLEMSADELRELAKKKQVRAFQDRGSWRFRLNDIQELARERGIGSDPELGLGEGKKPAAKRPADSDLLPVDFQLDDPNAVGQEKLESPKKGSSGKLAGKSGQKPGSDSDVRLVMEGGKGDPDSDVRLDEAKSPSSSKRKKGEDSSVRLVPPEGSPADSSVVPPGEKRPSDSDIRLDELHGGKKRDKDPGVVTEEIDLDAEEARARESGKLPRKSRPTQHAKEPALPTSSPFELSEPDVKLPPTGKAKAPDKKRGDTDSSSDFELIPFDSAKAPADLGSGDIPLLDDDEVSLGSEIRPGKANSGINLNDPADSGISLEGRREADYDLSLGAGARGKKEKAAAEDDSSEFELSLDDAPSDPSDSEFELNLDDSGAELPTGDSSDSEFELTLDDEGALAAVDDDAKDIFEETNFDVPSLDDESGSEAVALEEPETDLENSDDFEISLDDDSTGSATGSQVVALEDEGEADDAAATVARPRKAAAKKKQKLVDIDLDEQRSDEELDFDLEEAPKKKAKKKAAVADEEEEEEDEEAAVAAAPAPAAEWGPLPAILLLPTVVVMFVVGLMGFEMVRGMWGYQKNTVVPTPVLNNFKKLAE